MINIVDQSAWWNPLLTSSVFTWLGGIATIMEINYLDNCEKRRCI